MGARAKGPTGQRVKTAQTFIVFIVVALAGLIGRLVYIQVKLRPDLVDWSQRRQCSTVPIAGHRGAILDRRQRTMAGSQDRPTIYADPRLIEDASEVTPQLASILQTSPAEIQKLLEHPSSPGYVVLRRGADESDVEALRDIKPPIPGLNVLREPFRSYPMGSLAASARLPGQR